MDELNHLGLDFEVTVRKAREASYYWRINRQRYGPDHWITQGLWDQLTKAHADSDVAWKAYNDAWHAAHDMDAARERHPSSASRG